MAKVGTMEVGKNDTDGNIYGKGTLRTLKVHQRFELRPAQRDRSAPPPTEDSPTHELVAEVGGSKVPVGIAWQRKLERGDFAGYAMFSLAFNDPDMPEWTGNVAAFPRDDQGNYELVHSRPRQSQGKSSNE